MPQFSYVNIDLQIERLGEGYRAQVINSPVGQASQSFALPFQPFELDNFLLRLGRTRQRARRIESPEVEAAKEFGARLFKSVFDGGVRDCLQGSLEEARRNNARLRIRLRLADAPELANLPWEYLYNPLVNRFLTLSVNTPLVRYIELPERVRPLKVTPPLRALVMISSPRNVVPLDVEREWAKLHEALSDLRRRNVIVLERLEEATLPALQRQLRRNEYHIFHFIGHGGFDNGAQDGVLVLEDEHGQGQVVSGQHLGTVLHDHDSLRLVVLNACEGARSADDDPFAGTAQSLVQQGVPAVVAMQFEITDEAAITFAQEFYGAIADNFPVDAAITEARKIIFTQGNGLEWATPVLFMRAPDGYIFDIDTSMVKPNSARPSQQAARNEQEQHRLEALYTQALSAFYTRRWDQAIEVLEEIVVKQPEYEDAAGKLAEAKRQQQLAHHYAEGVRAVEAKAWAEAVDHFIAVSTLDSRYNDASARLTEAKHQKELAELYAEAQRLHKARAWDAVINIFEQIQQHDPTFHDEAELLASAHEARKVEQRQQQAGILYHQAIRSMNAGMWRVAREQLQQVQQLVPEYHETETLLTRVEQELVAVVEQERQRAEEAARLQLAERAQQQALEQENLLTQQRERERIEAAQQQQQVSMLYEQALRLVNTAQWVDAHTHLEQIQHLAPGYRDSETLLASVRQKQSTNPDGDEKRLEITQQSLPAEFPQHQVVAADTTPQQRTFPVQWLGSAVVLFGLLAALFFFVNQGGETPAAGKSTAGAAVAIPTVASWNKVDGTITYTTNPPTSGDHNPNSAPWGIYAQTPPDERLVHNLAHGGIIISYVPDKVDRTTLQQLARLARDLASQRNCIILAPRASIQDNKAIAITAWGWMALLDTYDENAIRTFWQDHVARGPELGEGNCG